VGPSAGRAAFASLHKSDEPLPDLVKRAYAVEIAAAGASDDRRQVLGGLVVALSCAGLQSDIE
jgi:hypothetical protein